MIDAKTYLHRLLDILDDRQLRSLARRSTYRHVRMMAYGLLIGRRRNAATP